MKDAFEAKICGMESQGIISRLDYDTVLQWLNSYVTVKSPMVSYIFALNLNSWTGQIYASGCFSFCLL